MPKSAEPAGLRKAPAPEARLEARGVSAHAAEHEEGPEDFSQVMHTGWSQRTGSLEKPGKNGVLLSSGLDTSPCVHGKG